jgi:uncharacterized protein with PIN domain
LRAIGLDTLWEDAIPDKDLIRRAIEEKRFVLTLDKRLLEEWCTDNVLLLKNHKPLEQFHEIIQHFNLVRPEEFFTRCLVCNTPLRLANAQEIAANPLPSDVLENQKEFHFCPRCNKIYWRGSHTSRIQATIEEIFSQGMAQNKKARLPHSKPD